MKADAADAVVMVRLGVIVAGAVGKWKPAKALPAVLITNVPRSVTDVMMDGMAATVVMVAMVVLGV
ncbi:hypothetical protein NCWK1_3852 [Nostoc cycadae WK-1]|uniref:Uncharacterized protein n=1 Tax=Nostoc cycadae WK-1 TaxID=1861711 RepID=A0A2H6LLK8_9NOSO|nr:hypothetical protein NCWK1_3852 [Nostoc cycadae WK-1]